MPTRGETGLHAFRQMRRGQAASKIQRAFRGKRRYKSKRSRYKQPLALKMHNFVERSTITTNLQIGPEASATGMIKEFSLNEIAQNGNYIALFEEYKIDKVVATFRYKSTGQYGYETGAALNMNEINPVLYFKVDHNDDVLETLATLKESAKCREFQFTNNKPTFDVVIKPACLIDVNNIHGALGISHRPRWGLWLPTDENAISFYGLKAYCVAAASGAHVPGSLQVTYKIYFSMKNND